MAQRAAQRERLAAPEAAVAAASAENPETPVALHPSTGTNIGIPSWVQPSAHRLLVGDADQSDALRESAQVGLVCFTSQNLMLSDSTRVVPEQLFQRLPVRVGFEPYYQAGIVLGKLKTAAATAVSMFQTPQRW